MEPLAQALGLTGGAAAAVRETLERLEVHPGRMGEHLDAAGGTLLAERIALALPAGAPRGQRRGRAVRRAAGVAGTAAFRDALLDEPDVAARLDAGRSTSCSIRPAISARATR